MSNYSGNPNIAGLVLSTEIPDDGKKLMASDVNVALEAAFDNFAYLKGRGVVAIYSYAFDNENPINNGMIAEQFTTSAYVDGAKVRLDIPGAQVGDVVLVDFAAFFVCDTKQVGEWGDVRLVVTQGYGGQAPVSAPMAGARVFLPGTYAYPGDPAGVRHFNTMGSATGGLLVSVAGTVRIGLQGKTGFSGGSVQIVSVAKLRGVLLRPM